MKRFNHLSLQMAIATILLCSSVAFSQPSFGVLYFGNPANSEYWTPDLAHDLGHLLMSELVPLGTIHLLEREHVLLLMKEVDPPKIDNLEGDVIQEIGKKEELQYLVKGNLMAFELKGNVVSYKIRLAIYKTSDATITWEKAPEITRELTDKELAEHILLKAEFYKPTIRSMTKEIRKLKFQ